MAPPQNPDRTGAVKTPVKALEILFLASHFWPHTFRSRRSCDLRASKILEASCRRNLWIQYCAGLLFFGS
jgi:hypothetical protein